MKNKIICTCCNNENVEEGQKCNNCGVIVEKSFTKKTMILGVTGSISAYKATELISLFKKYFDIHVVMTKASTQFITPLTLQILSGNKVYIDVFDELNPSEVTHIAMAKKADIVLIAPATAQTISKIAFGMADNMLTSIVLATNVPVFIAPAMNSNMYLNPVTTNNIDTLKNRNFYFIDPIEGLLACGEKGTGKLQKSKVIFETISKFMNIKIE